MKKLLSLTAIAAALVFCLPASTCSVLTQNGPTSTTVATDVAQVASDANLVATAVAGLVPDLPSLLGTNTATQQTVQEAITGLQNTAKQLQAAATTAAQQPLVTQLESYANTILQQLGALNLSGTPGKIIMGLNLLLPAIEVAVGFLLPATTTTATASLAPSALAQRAALGRSLLHQAIGQ